MTDAIQKAIPPANAAAELMQAAGLIEKALRLYPDMPDHIAKDLLLYGDVLQNHATWLYAYARTTIEAK